MNAVAARRIIGSKVDKKLGPVQVIGAGEPVIKYDDPIFVSRDSARPKEHLHKKLQLSRDDLIQAQLYLSRKQRDKCTVEGVNLRRELARLCPNVLNANALQFFLTHPHFIPGSWEMGVDGRPLYVCFWGDQFRLQHFGDCVPCLFKTEKKGWCTDFVPIHSPTPVYNFDEHYPAAYLASDGGAV